MKRVLIWLVVVVGVFAVAGMSPGFCGGKIALLDSNNTKLFFGAHYPACGPTPAGDVSYYLGADEYQRYFRGWQWLLDELKAQDAAYEYDLVGDDTLTAAGLADYEVLILSNVAMLTDDQTRAVQKWVLSGGRLLATFGSGYKDFASDPRQIDGWKEQKGGTFALHQLWHDPIGKLFSSHWLVPVDPQKGVSVDVKITRYDGPTASLGELQLPGDILGYGAEANLLIQRPVNHPSVLGSLTIGNADWKANTPAIISTRQSKGLVVYFAFAPEYILYKELEMPGSLIGPLPAGWPSCNDGQNWGGRSDQLRLLMSGALTYLLAN